MAFVDPGEGGLLPPDNFENPGEILQGKGFSRPPAIGAPKGFTAPPGGIVGPGFNAPGPIAQSPGFQMPAPGPMTNSDPIMDEWAAALRGSIQRITGKNVMTSKATPREEVNKAFEGMKQGQQSLSLEEIRRQVELENSLGEPIGFDARYERTKDVLDQSEWSQGETPVGRALRPPQAIDQDKSDPLAEAGIEDDEMEGLYQERWGPDITPIRGLTESSLRAFLRHLTGTNPGGTRNPHGSPDEYNRLVQYVKR